MSFDNIPLLGSRWARKEPFDPSKGKYNAYTVTCITYPRSDGSGGNVVYKGDNGRFWEMPLSDWPRNLKPETDESIELPPLRGMTLWEVLEEYYGFSWAI